MKRIYSTFSKLLVASLSLGLVMGATSCKKEGCTDPTADNYDDEADDDDNSCTYPVDDQGTVEKTGMITADETWTSNNIYYLDGKVVVSAGVTLTIEAGTIIKGRQGNESLASALVVARGGMIMAEGTASSPIIFTSELDDITYGEKVGTNLDRTDNELWGGVVILGSAPSSTENGDDEGNIEGINPDDNFGKYGGASADDNSGTLSYVSIRHGGITIGEGNELNALTLGGVGNGTTISNIEVYATLDDGIECFGGTVNISNALVYYQGDDGIDLDQNYSGTIENFAVIHGDGIGTDEGLEIDGPEGSTYTDGKFTLRNGLCMSDGSSDGSAADFKSGAQGTVENVTFDYSSVGGKEVKFRTKFVTPGIDCSHKSDAYRNLITDELEMNACSNDAGVKVYDGDEPDPALCESALASAQTSAAAAASTDGAGATIDPASLFSWGAAGTRGEL